MSNKQYESLIFFYYFRFVFLFSIVMPTFQNYFDSAGVLIVNGALIVFLFFYLFRMRVFLFFQSNAHKARVFRYLIPLLLMAMVLPLSMAIGLLFGNINLIERDFYEGYRPLLYMMTFLFSFSFFSKEGSLDRFESLLLFVFIIVVVLGLNHYFGFFSPISYYYTKTLNIESYRVSTPFTNPYDYAFFMTFFVYYFFMKAFFHNMKYIPFFFMSIVMLVLPQSRSVMVGFLVGFFLIMPFLLSFTEFKVKRMIIKKRLLYFYVIFVLILILLIGALPYLIENFRYLTGQFVRLIENGDIGNSAGLRIQQFLFALDKAVNNPLILVFGNGPAKDEMQFVESIYNYLFYRYGLIGVFCYFLILFLAVFETWKIVKYLRSNSKNYCFFYAVLLWLLTIPLLSIGNNFTEQVRLSFFYYTILGLVSASYYEIILKSKK